LALPSLLALVNKKITEICVLFLTIFIKKAVLDAGGRSDLTEGTLVELWLQKGPSYTDSVQVPLDRASIESDTAFELCNCLPGMGELFFQVYHIYTFRCFRLFWDFFLVKNR
jgi:hypothetical protein